MKTATRTSARLVALLLVVLGAALGPGQALAEDRPAPADGIVAQTREAQFDGLIGRPAPAFGVAASPREAPAAGIVTPSNDGFDYLDALIGVAVATALAVLLLGGARVARGNGRLAHR